MLWRIKSFFSRIRSRIFNIFSGRGSLYRVESLRRGATSTTKKKKKILQCLLIRGLENMKKDRWLPEGKDSTTFLI